MRFYSLASLTVITLLVRVNALPNVKQTYAVKIATLEGGHTTVADENGVHTKRSLRVIDATDNQQDEERGWNEVAQKVKRLVKYNKWIFSNKSPEWVAEHHTEFAQSYKIFWENRMVRGGKYA